VSETLAKKWGPSARLPQWRPSGSAFPLALITPASDRTISSTLGHLRAQPTVEMHPDDAAARGLRDGQTVRVWNDRGEVVLPLEVTDGIARGVIASEKGAWLNSSPTGQTVSALVSAEDRTDIADGACFNDVRVEVAAA